MTANNSRPTLCPMRKSVSEFEKIADDEAAQIEEIARLTTLLQDKRISLPTQAGKLLRGVHPKSHGCLSAEFCINSEIDKQYQVGLFATPGKKYNAQIRFSNASVNIDPDSKYVSGREGVPSKWEHGSRGMAVKIYDVEGEVIDIDNDNQKNQDFLMINTPEFVFSDVRSYLYLTRALFQSEFGNDSTTLFALGKITLDFIMKPRGATNSMPTQADFEALKIFLGSENNKSNFEIPDGFTLGDLQKVIASIVLIVTKIQRQTVRNPLQVQYFGASPYLFGDHRVMKFSAACATPTKQVEFGIDPAEDMDDNYLRAAVDKTLLEDSSIVFDFKILIKDNDFGENNILIEDATTTWKQDGVAEADQYVNVAKLTIKAPQKVLPEDQCENLVFTPWHSLKEHQPIGGINRLRRSVYKNSAIHRRS